MIMAVDVYIVLYASEHLVSTFHFICFTITIFPHSFSFLYELSTYKKQKQNGNVFVVNKTSS